MTGGDEPIMLDRRIAGERRPCRIAAIITTDRHRKGVPCTVENLSERGAKIRFAKAVGLPKQFKLHLPIGRGVQERAVELRWTLGIVVGVQFQG